MVRWLVAVCRGALFVAAGESPHSGTLALATQRGGGRARAGYHRCAVLASVWCCGGNVGGQLGSTNTDPTLVPTPMQLPGL